MEILALRHQLAVLQRQGPRRPRLRRADRLSLPEIQNVLSSLAIWAGG
jgi:hypothetical protein